LLNISIAAPSTWLRRLATSAASSTLLLTVAFAMNLVFLSGASARDVQCWKF
jgi:hypothetical protein